MRKFLTVLLVVTVLFTFSFSCAFAADTYTRADYEAYYDSQVSTYEKALDGAIADYMAACGFSSDITLGSAKYGITAGDLGLSAAYANMDLTESYFFTESAMNAAMEAISDAVAALLDNYYVETIAKYFDVDSAVSSQTTTVSPAEAMGTMFDDLEVYGQKLTDLAGSGTVGNRYTGIMNAVINTGVADLMYGIVYTTTASEVYDATIAIISAFDESLYSAANAAQVSQLKDEFITNMNEQRDSEYTQQNVKALNYVNLFGAYLAAIEAIPTADEEYGDGVYDEAEAQIAINAALSDWLNFGLNEVYTSIKLAKGDDATAKGAYGEYIAAMDSLDAYDNVYAAPSTMFGVTADSISSVTSTEASAINTAYISTIQSAVDIIRTYAMGIYNDELAGGASYADAAKEAIDKIKELYDGEGNNISAEAEYLYYLDRALEISDIYASVEALADQLKGEYSYGIKVYDDDVLDAAVAAAEALIYGDLPDTYSDAIDYIYAAAGEKSIYATNWGYEYLMQAIEEAKAKFTSGDDVYLKSTYADSEADAWEAIKDEAIAALTIAESYDDIYAAMAAAADAMSGLMLASEEKDVVAARAEYIEALEEQEAVAKKAQSGYRDASYDDVTAAGIAAINAATSVDAVVAAYNEAVANYYSMPTSAELTAAAEALIAQIAALPTTDITVNDADAIMDALDAYLAYEAMPGADAASEITNTKILNTDLDVVMSLIKADIEARAKDAAERYTAYSYASDRGAADLVAMEDEIIALVAEIEDFNSCVEAIEASTGLNTEFKLTEISTAEGSDYMTLRGALYAENKIWNAQMHMVVLEATTAGTAAEKRDAIENYEALTLRQQLKLEMTLDTNTLIARLKQDVIYACESLKITASSTAAKGSITVSWKVEGDASGIDEYRVYKSVKRNSGYGKTPYWMTQKMTYKNTKELKAGTRYYYKVRAAVKIDGVRYYSDYSNKAYRIAK